MNKLFAVMVTVVLYACGTAFALEGEDAFKQAMEQFNKDWGNNAAREQVIVAGRDAKPPLSIPEEARRRMARGAAAFKVAKNSNDFADAVIEFVSARDLAPWWDAPYFKLSLAYERIGNAPDTKPADKEHCLKQAMQNISWYLAIRGCG